MGMTSDPIDRAFANGGGDEHFNALHGGMRECGCDKCRAARTAPIETRADLIARVAAQMGVCVSMDRTSKSVLTPAAFAKRWAVVKAARRRQNVARWR